MMKEEIGLKERLWKIKKEEEETEQQPWPSVSERERERKRDEDGVNDEGERGGRHDCVTALCFCSMAFGFPGAEA